MTVKIVPEAVIDTAATTTKISMLKNEITAASIGQAGGAAEAATTTMRKARPSSAPLSRDAPAPPSAFQAMETLTPRMNKVRLFFFALSSRE